MNAVIHAEVGDLRAACGAATLDDWFTSYDGSVTCHNCQALTRRPSDPTPFPRFRLFRWLP